LGGYVWETLPGVGVVYYTRGGSRHISEQVVLLCFPDLVESIGGGGGWGRRSAWPARSNAVLLKGSRYGGVVGGRFRQVGVGLSE